MRKLVAILAASSMLLAACDEEFGAVATAEFVGGIVKSTDGRIDPNDPIKTAQNTLSGDTIGNKAEGPALETTRNIAADTALDDADADHERLAGTDGASLDDYRTTAGKYDHAISLVPRDASHSQQLADALGRRAAFNELWAGALEQRGHGADASEAYDGAAADYEEAARTDLRDPVHGNLLANAAGAYYDGGFLKEACASAHQAVQAKTDQEHGFMAVRILELGKCP